MGQQRHATIYVDYQQRAREFSVGDLAYPLAGGSTDESQAGRVVAVWPAIGQVDIEFAWGSGRYGVEDLQRVTSIVAIPPNPEHTTVPGGAGTVPVSGSPRTAAASIDRVAHAWIKKALYWASSDRHYQATRAELDSGSYTCPKCKEGALKHAIYKRSEGKSERLLGCPSCLFLIKRCDIIGDADYEDGEYVEESGTAEGMLAGKKAAQAPSIMGTDWEYSKSKRQWTWEKDPHVASFIVTHDDVERIFRVHAKLPDGKAHTYHLYHRRAVDAYGVAYQLYEALAHGKPPRAPSAPLGEWLTEAWVPPIPVPEGVL